MILLLEKTPKHIGTLSGLDDGISRDSLKWNPSESSLAE
jgi:hypothetical protein